MLLALLLLRKMEIEVAVLFPQRILLGWVVNLELAGELVPGKRGKTWSAWLITPVVYPQGQR